MARELATVILVFALSHSAMASPKEDCEKLMDSVLPFAEKMLREHGEFHPYGGAMKPSGEIVAVGGDTGEELPKSTDLIGLLADGLRHSATKGEYIATAIAYDVRVAPPGQSEKTDAVCIALDHRDAYSVRVFVPYTLAHGGVSLKEPFASEGDGNIFPSK
jgi:hypothetical protein